jgi:hypothetical protein
MRLTLGFTSLVLDAFMMRFTPLTGGKGRVRKNSPFYIGSLERAILSLYSISHL